MAKTARHSAVKMAARQTRSIPKVKKAAPGAKPVAKRKPKTTMEKVTSAIGNAGTTTVEAVKALAHKGEELVGKVLGGEEKPATGASGSKKKKK